MSAFFRRRVQATIEHMIQELDELDRDPDLEAEPDDEDNHDRELDPADDGIADMAALKYFFAEMDRRSRTRYR